MGAGRHNKPSSESPETTGRSTWQRRDRCRHEHSNHRVEGGRPGEFESTRFCRGIRLGRRFWACVDLARVVSAFVVFANRPPKLDWIMQSSARTVQEYLKELPTDRREAINAVRGVILANLPKGYEECMSYGMIGYVVPHSIYPKGYQCNPKVPLPFVNLGSQKNHMAFHLMCCYCD